MTKKSASMLVLLALAVTLPAGAVDKPSNKAVAKAHQATSKHVEPAVLVPVAVSPEQMDIANRVLVGQINCELSVVINMAHDVSSPGRFFLDMGSKRYAMLPMVTSTGAVRLEEESSGAVWLQLGNKSMLMNQKEGKRLADDCKNPDQLLVAQELERNPQPGLLDVPKDALVPIGSGGAVQELVPNPEPKPKARVKTKKSSKKIAG